MNQQQFHWIEKVQVQVATALAVVVVYFVAWPLVAPDDPAGPVAFLATGSYAGIAAFAVLLCVLAGLCAAVTVTSRPESALLAAAFGAGGVSLRSPQIRSLLWTRNADIGPLFGGMIAELLMLGAVAIAAIVIAACVRRAVASVSGRWLWKTPLVDAAGRPGVPPSPVEPYLRRLFSGVTSPKGGDPKQDATVRRAQYAGCFLLSLVLAMVLLVVLLQSAERGQVLFSLVASFALAVLVAHQAFPVRNGSFLWLVPVVAGVVFYAMAWRAAPDGALEWSAIRLYARALPVDWLAAGGGGALLGYWLSERIHEARHLEQKASLETR
jgi:hypothetical protein